MKEIDNYYAQREEPARSCLLALREIILRQDADITEAWKYKMPFFCYKGKMFCYLWVQKKTGLPYLGVVEGKLIEHPELIIEGRSRMKIMLMDPDKDLPLEDIRKILDQALNLHKKGIVKLK